MAEQTTEQGEGTGTLRRLGNYLKDVLTSKGAKKAGKGFLRYAAPSLVAAMGAYGMKEAAWDSLGPDYEGNYLGMFKLLNLSADSVLMGLGAYLVKRELENAGQNAEGAWNKTNAGALAGLAVLSALPDIPDGDSFGRSAYNFLLGAPVSFVLGTLGLGTAGYAIGALGREAQARAQERREEREGLEGRVEGEREQGNLLVRARGAVGNMSEEERMALGEALYELATRGRGGS